MLSLQDEIYLYCNMKILLVGEYSRLHLTLAEGLRSLGYEVLLASDGDGHKQYERDIDLTRKGSGVIDTVKAFWKIYKAFRQFKDYDVVQIINPCFLTLSVSANRYFFNQLKKKNKKIFLGAFGDDSFWIKACLSNSKLRYSEFFVDGKPTHLAFNKKLIDRWINTASEDLNKYIADRVDGVIACLYEYYISYEDGYADKLIYIPLPINCEKIEIRGVSKNIDRIKFFIGIDKNRSEYKGTDLMKKVLLNFVERHPEETDVAIVESVSYKEYQELMKNSHVVLDQLYSYSPSMNPLQAMASGKVVISGGEPEIYELMGHVTNRPIINVYPTEKGIECALEEVLENKKQLAEWSRRGRSFVEEFHDHIKVAEQYLDFWNR